MQREKQWKPRNARALRSCALVLASLASCAPAFAGTDSTSMAVSATVIASCSISAGTLAFTNYNPVSATPLDAATTLSVTCTNGSGYEISMNAGGGSGATVAARKMTSSGNLLTYSIYRDGARTNVWGISSGVNTYSGTGTGAAQTIDVYGRVPINQTAPIGSYTDSVTVTVTY